MGCYCFEENYKHFIDLIFEYSMSKPKEYILVNEKPILESGTRSLIKLLATAEYKRLDADNIKTAFFIVCLLKFNKITKKEEFFKLFDNLDPKNKEDLFCMQTIMLHKRNFDILKQRSEELNQKLKDVLHVEKFLEIKTIADGLIKLHDKFEQKVRKEDDTKELSQDKIKELLGKFFIAYDKYSEIKEITTYESSNEGEFTYRYNKTKREKIWFVDTSGTTAYATGQIGSDLGRNLANFEGYLIAESLNKSGGKTHSFKSDQFIKIIEESLVDSEKYILLCPFNFSSKIRDLIRYDYSNEKRPQYVEIKNKKINIIHYTNRSNINKAFLYPIKAINWKNRIFSFKPIDEFEEQENKIAEILFRKYENTEGEEKKSLNENELIIQIKYGYNIEINSEKILSFNYD